MLFVLRWARRGSPPMPRIHGAIVLDAGFHHGNTPTRWHESLHREKGAPHDRSIRFPHSWKLRDPRHGIHAHVPEETSVPGDLAGISDLSLSRSSVLDITSSLSTCMTARTGDVCFLFAVTVTMSPHCSQPFNMHAARVHSSPFVLP
jgi:hypothetical protein